MLTNPPCISFLIRCNGNTDTTSSVNASENTSSNRVSDVANYNTRSSSQSSNRYIDLRANLPRFASGSGLRNILKDSFAEYVLKVMNTGSNALTDVKIYHGPLPFGATFDPTKSSQGCNLNIKTTECMLNLGPGEAKDLLLTYKSSSSFSCAIAKVLNSARTSLQNLTTGSVQTNPVVVTVTCTMRTVDRNDASSSSASSFGSSEPRSATGSANVTVVPSVVTLPSGYKPYSITTMPRTGAADYLFASLTDHSFILVPKQQKDSGFSLVPIFLLSCISIFVVALLAKQSFRHR